MSKQIKSQDRVQKLGEVFTNEKEINAMLDLIKDKSYEINSTFLEPSCGNGNFLVKILERKLKTVRDKYADNEIKYLAQSILAITSIYGIDIMQDNVEESIDRMYNIYKTYYQQCFHKNIPTKASNTIYQILKLNIQQGNTLTGLKDDNTDIIINE